MERKLYAISREVKGNVDLIGVLTENNGLYTFEYKLGGKLPKWYLRIKEFPDVTKKYIGDEVKPFISRLVPKRDGWLIDVFLKQNNMTEYDEWELLKVTGKVNPKLDVFLVSELGSKVVSYE